MKVLHGGLVQMGLHERSMHWGRWVLSSLAILDRIDWIDKRALEAWILQCQASTVLDVNCAGGRACGRACVRLV